MFHNIFLFLHSPDFDLMQHRPLPDFSKEFRDVVPYFAEKHLIKETKENIFAKVCFFQHHPKINKGLLDAAISKTILSRRDFTDDILSPIVEGEYNTINYRVTLTAFARFFN